MRLLIDQDIATRTASRHRDLGHDAVSAFEIGMNRLPDPELLEFALDESRILATLDYGHHRQMATE